MKQIQLSMVLVLAGGLLISGCKSKKIQDPEIKTTPEGNFILYIANQQSKADSIDISVYIDDKLAVSEYFYEDEDPREFKFDLDPGRYNLTVKTSQLDYKNTWKFQMKEKHWGFVQYWQDADRGKEFRFRVSGTPLEFD